MSGPVDRDPGLQPERTLLSWQRTVILLILVGMLFMRGSLVPETPHIPELSMSVRATMMTMSLVLAGLLALHVRHRWRRLGHGTIDPASGLPPTNVASPWAMVTVSVGVLVLSVVLVVATVLAA
ncbi:uncharacterized protein DUF202 [Nocardiopsis sp. Huas11]|uniref:DUF202 domain-containing protein n=1 Tax=Nocardiopsis sp. Huas11 TaxID=2183912 RepID=UPI000EB143CC|nr:DUF202 domain-containing protein [Nocardiopsis sp. Huas11]RKS06335.1 uncharacterized protein DUF202 [Nocardiopsis sp. Huas11]